MTLTKVEYLRIATVLPVLAPFPMGAVLVGSALIGTRLPEWFGNATVLAGMGLFLFGPVYIVVIGCVLWIVRHRTWRAHAVGAVIAPLLMVIAVGLFHRAIDPSVGVWSAMQTWAPQCLKLGYAYVAVAVMGMVFLQRTGWIRDEPPNRPLHPSSGARSRS
jgi:hypothetical protein